MLDLWDWEDLCLICWLSQLISSTLLLVLVNCLNVVGNFFASRVPNAILKPKEIIVAHLRHSGMPLFSKVEITKVWVSYNLELEHWRAEKSELTAQICGDCGGKGTEESACLDNWAMLRLRTLSSTLSFTYTLVSWFQHTVPVRWQQMSQRKGSVSLGRKEGSRRATCVYIAVSGTGSLPCHAPCVLFGSDHLLSGTTLVASDVSQSTLGSLY